MWTPLKPSTGAVGAQRWGEQGHYCCACLDRCQHSWCLFTGPFPSVYVCTCMCVFLHVCVHEGCPVCRALGPKRQRPSPLLGKVHLVEDSLGKGWGAWRLLGAGKSTGVQGAAGGCREPQGCTVRQAEGGGELSE